MVMKKLILSLMLCFVLLACDDGDITLHSFNFSSQTVQKCSEKEILFKINDNELIAIQLPETVFEDAFANEETEDSPRVYAIGSSNIVVYRLYSNSVSSATLCDELPPATPSVTNEWEASGGSIQIETNKILDDDDTVIGYTHNITLLHVNFSGNDGSFSFESYVFGDYEVDL